jgi:hypothetical protein
MPRLDGKKPRVMKGSTLPPVGKAEQPDQGQETVQGVNTRSSTKVVVKGQVFQ